MELLETPRLLLRPFGPGDAALVHPIYSDPDVMRYVATGPMDRSRSPSDCWTTTRVHQRRHGYSFWAVIERASGTLIGDAGLYRTPAGEVELGYTLGTAWWGRGYATEAASRWLGAAFGDLGIFEVVALAEPANLASLHVLEKLGMRRDGERTRVRPSARGVPDQRDPRVGRRVGAERERASSRG